MRSRDAASRRFHHTTDQPASAGGTGGRAARARFGELERARIQLRNRLTAWTLSPNSEDDSTDLLDRIDSIESEQDAFRAALTGRPNDPLAA